MLSFNSTRHLILNYCKRCTLEEEWNHFEELLNTHKIAQEFSISRSLASQYLNDFVKEKHLIKISSRPVVFLSRDVLETKYQIKVKEEEYISFQELLLEIETQADILRDFKKLIGYEDSLRLPISQIKGCLKYPTTLPIMISGENGTGKKALVKAICEYADHHRLISDAKSCQIIRIPVSYDRQTEMMEALYGKNQMSILEQVQDGYIIFEHAENLSYEFQMLLKDLIMTNRYEDLYRKQKLKFKGRVLFTVNEKKAKYIQGDLFKLFPVIVKLPPYEERDLAEKESLIMHFLKREAFKIKKNIYVSEQVLAFLTSYQFENNLDDLEKVIQSLCIRVNAEQEKEKHLKINAYHLIYYFDYSLPHKKHLKEEKTELIDVLNYQKESEIKGLLELMGMILDGFVKCEEKELALNVFFEDVYVHIKDYFNYLVFQRNKENKYLESLEHSLKYVFEEVVTNYRINLPVNIVSVIAKNYDLMRKHHVSIDRWKEENKERLGYALQVLERCYLTETMIIDQVNYLLNVNYEFELDEINRILAIINLSYYNDEINKRKYLGIIIAHGYATASSIADAVNSLLDAYIFDAFDMSLETSTEDIISKLKHYVERMSVQSDIILLVDMGSLEDLEQCLCEMCDKNIGILNNVSTRMALEVGSKILQDEEIASILESVSENQKVSYKLHTCKNKRDAIIFTSENGLSPAESVKNLFVRSLPKPIDLEYLLVDYQALMEPKTMEDLSRKYHILFTSGIINDHPLLEDYISLEEIVSMDNISKLNQALSSYIEPSDLDLFSRNLIRNFSLENVVRNLTILDPETLLLYVEDFVDQIEMQLGKRFSGQIAVGLYIHISCLVERLVTKEPIDIEIDQSFIEENSEMVKVINQSFSRISEHYRVSLPISEIVYIYNYIQEDLGIQ